ncbi:MAG: ADP-ribosylation factor-like protein [Desulforegulaceae bacterium]|nr:ADP-ribosylation factor-like protein [Desulforegulaceae bacterium]
MAVFNIQTREIECKIVFYGPGRGGKTTNLEYIHKTFKKNITGDLVSIDTQGDRTLFFDFLPIGLGKIRGCEVKVQLFTVPGQPQYASTRKLVLKGADGIVFVADSLKVQRKNNILSLQDLHDNLKEYDRNIFKVPLVLQYNKRDLLDQGLPLLEVETMEKDLNRQLKVPSFPGSAIRGDGVGQALKKCLELTLENLQKELNWAG